MKNVKKEYGLNALVELPPAPDGEMLAAFAKAMRVVAAGKTFDEMSVLDLCGISHSRNACAARETAFERQMKS